MADHRPAPRVRLSIDAAAARLAAPLWAEIGEVLGPAWAPVLARIRQTCGDAWAADVASERRALVGTVRDAARSGMPWRVAEPASTAPSIALGWLAQSMSDDLPAARVAIALAAGDLATAAATLGAVPVSDPAQPLLRALTARALGRAADAEAALATLPAETARAVRAGADLSSILGAPLASWVDAQVP